MVTCTAILNQPRQNRGREFPHLAYTVVNRQQPTGANEELFLRSPGGLHEEPLPGPGPEVPTVTQPTFGRDARVAAILALEGSVRRQLLARPWSPPLEILQEVRASSAQRPRAAPSPLFLAGLDPCQPDPVERRQRSPSMEVHGQPLIDLGEVGVGATEGPVPPPVPPRRRRSSPAPSEVQRVRSRGAWEGPDRTRSQRPSPTAPTAETRSIVEFHEFGDVSWIVWFVEHGSTRCCDSTSQPGAWRRRPVRDPCW